LDFHDFISAWSHLLMAAYMLFAGLIMLRLAKGHSKLERLSIAIYAGSAIVLYSASGLFHGIQHFGVESKRIWQLVDQTAIFGLIYGSNVPLMVYFLPPRQRNWLLGLMGLVAVVGAMALWTNPPHALLCAVFVAMGFLGLVPMRTYWQYLGRWGALWVCIIATLYTLGAICEAIEWPVIVPGTSWFRFSYHEMLHLFVVAGTLAHNVLVVRFVLAHRRKIAKRRITVDRARKSDHNQRIAAPAIPPALERL
jgi:hemolysin III